MYLGPFPTVTLSDEVADLRRELRMREKVVYPAQVNAGTLPRHEAEQRIACTRATLARLEAELAAVTPQQLGLGI